LPSSASAVSGGWARHIARRSGPSAGTVETAPLALMEEGMDAVTGERENGGGPPGRRAAGELESGLMAVLWASPGPMTAAQVSEQFSGELAYTTVLTILSRLFDKGKLTRQRSGRGYSYVPVRDEAADTAGRMVSLLDRGSDRQAVLARFVAELSDADEALIQDLLRGEQGR
jgi:predicted transcriptional regulator